MSLLRNNQGTMYYDVDGVLFLYEVDAAAHCNELILETGEPHEYKVCWLGGPKASRAGSNGDEAA